MSFFTELKRRHVYRVALLYLVVGWLVLQVTDVLMSLLTLPDWTGKLVFLLLLTGFPLALVLAWAFELTPEGLRREVREAAADSPAEAPPGRPDLIVPAVLVSLALALGYLFWQYQRSGQSGEDDPREIRSLAVLPLTNLTNDPSQSYFVAGMHDALITELSKIDALKVISRTSAMRYQDDASKSMPEIGRELGVEAVVEGSVLRAGDTVRISVQLIETASDRHLWADNFDRELSDILVLYSEVTREIANQIRVTLTADERADMSAASSVDPEVYELYLRGRYLCDNWSPEEMAEGIRLLEEAVRLEPDNAPARAQLALCLQYSAFFGYLDPSEILAQAEAIAREAVRLDDRLAEAHVALAGVRYYMGFEPREAMKSLERALELNPTSVRALLHASWLQGESGQFEEAFERIRRALRLDPLSTVVNDALGQLYYLSRDFPSAVNAYRKALDLDRSDPSLHYHLAWPLEQLGRFEEAISLHEKAVDLSDGASLYRAALAYAHGMAGAPEEARVILGELRDDAATAPFDMAIVFLGLGETDQVMDWLEKSYEARDSHFIYLNRDPRFDPLRSDPRFIRLIERIDWLESDARLRGAP
jgi:TolB-like protein/Flp pilus assembly protein TadD